MNPQTPPQPLIPEDKLPAVTRGLQSAFHVSTFESISTVTGGHTNALVYRIVVHETPYLLKIIMRNEDPTRHYTCMKLAADAGIAPPVRYTDTEARVSITDFIRVHSPSQAEALLRLPRILRSLHDLPLFDAAPFNTTCTFLLGKNAMSEGFMARFQASGLLPAEDMSVFAAAHQELVAAYTCPDTDIVSSHNDLFKPDNILFDGAHLWLVDWEAAFRNDRYADLAVVANHLLSDESQERRLLADYLGVTPTQNQWARLHLMRQLSHLFYTAAFIQIGSQGKAVQWDDPLPGFAEFNRHMWAGDIDLADPPTKILYGKAHWGQFRQNRALPSYQEALQIAAENRLP